MADRARSIARIVLVATVLVVSAPLAVALAKRLVRIAPLASWSQAVPSPKPRAVNQVRP
jgi:hypothetical protein